MKYIKKFESASVDELKIGDYVICEDNGTFSEELLSVFINNNIGQFIRMDYDNHFYIIEYKNIPKELRNSMVYNDRNKIYIHCVIMEKYEIKYFSSNKEDCEIYLAAKNYNI